MTNREKLKKMKPGDVVTIYGYHVSYQMMIPGHMAYVVEELNQSFRSIAKVLGAIIGAKARRRGQTQEAEK